MKSVGLWVPQKCEFPVGFPFSFRLQKEEHQATHINNLKGRSGTWLVSLVLTQPWLLGFISRLTNHLPDVMDRPLSTKSPGENGDWKSGFRQDSSESTLEGVMDVAAWRKFGPSRASRACT